MLGDSIRQFAIDAFGEEFADKYLRVLDGVWHDLCMTNMYISALDAISSFRFDLFGGVHNTFWSVAAQALYEAGVLGLWRVAFDESTSREQPALTLNSLKSHMMRHFQDSTQQAAFRARLRDLHFNKQIEELRRAIKEVRHEQIAHHQWSATRQGPARETFPLLHLGRLTEIRDLVNSLFHILCIGHRKALLYEDWLLPDLPGREKGHCTPSDLQQLLDLIARESVLLNMPEEQRDFWPTYREKHLTEADIDVLNVYRRRFGKPTV